MKKEKTNRPSGKKGKRITSIISILIGASIGVYVARKTNDSLSGEKSFLTSVIGLIVLYVSIYLHIILHEGGHLIAGLLTGYQFVSFRIGKFMLIRKSGKMQLKLYSLKGTGGQCLLAPPELEEGQYPCVFYNLGGGLVNFIAAAVAIVITLSLPTDFKFRYALEIFSLIGLLLGLSNLIPMRIGQIDNDGNNILHMKKSVEAKKALWYQLKISSLLAEDKRLKEMSEEYFTVSNDLMIDNALCSGMVMMAYSRAMDEMNFEKAKEIGGQLLSGEADMLPLYKNLLIGEMLFNELISDNRSEKIDEFYTEDLKRFLKAYQGILSGLRIQYAIDKLMFNNEKKAEKVLKMFNKKAAHYPYGGELAGERELIQYVDRIYAERNTLKTDRA